MENPENEVGEEVAPCYVGDEVGDVFTFFPWQVPLNSPVFTDNASAPATQKMAGAVVIRTSLRTILTNHQYLISYKVNTMIFLFT
ncbi:hypothetical protein [Morganella morganii]|uniref:hypothetical protein n=1 Tax=Morganella morganii TaxID=582 RepID=UPI001C450F0D|nr:hypothetical protein [Morganella morganii]QXO72582.1 hypothetical protein JC793_17715 [Morganella morganii]